jgi:Rne/Rng family ribonuclease
VVVTRVLLLNLADDEERRAALVEDGRLSLLWAERADERSFVGNIYKGRVTHVERSIGAAFVDIGLERPGFLHGDDVAPFGDESSVPAEPSTPREPRPIESVLSVGQEIVVQVVRDVVLHKGPTLSGRVSIPGRLLVLLQGSARKAVSRRITDEAEHDRLAEIIAAVPGAEAFGVVARTAAVGATAEDLTRELRELLAEEATLRAAAQSRSAPALLREESDFVVRAVRELTARAPEGSSGPTRVIVDSEDGRRRAEASLVGASNAPVVELHAGPVPLFHAHGVERDVRALDDPRAPLPGGACLVIHETEALWAIDVNSGRMRDAASLEATALAVDLAAAAEVARQIRLRDLGGLIVVDFIDCVEPSNRAKVEEKLRAELLKDPARMRVAPLSEFMVAEITRRRVRSGPAHAGSQTCPSCRGRGRTRAPRSTGLAAIRDLRAFLAGGVHGVVEIACAPPVAAELESRVATLQTLEQETGTAIRVHVDPTMPHDRFEVRKAAPAERA